MFLQIVIDLVSQEESFAKIHVLTFGKYIYIYIFFFIIWDKKRHSGKLVRSFFSDENHFFFLFADKGNVMN